MTIPKKVDKALKERASIDDYPCCEICGKPGANNRHHRKNLSQGGLNVLSNLMLLDGSGTTGCHGFVTEHPAWADTTGYTVLRNEEPAAKPVRYRGVFCHLDDFGGVFPVAKPEDGVAS